MRLTKPISILFVGFFLLACQPAKKFNVSGKVMDAVAGSVLYLEHTGLMKTEKIDSVKLKENGDFSFSQPCHEYPDFYQLRLNNKTILLTIDSCERIIVNANANQFALDYTIENSPANSEIQILRRSAADIQQKINTLSTITDAAEKSIKRNEITKEIETHKKMAGEMIVAQPISMSSYFALYQKINNNYLFSPYLTEDRPYYAAVATAFTTFMPEYERTKNLESLVLDAIRADRQEKQNKSLRDFIDQNATKGYIDIELPDKNGNIRKLSDLEGKVVLLDFSVYETENSASYTFALRDLYNKYHKKGFEIFQVSLDKSKLRWETNVKNIPWVCVRDEDGPNTISVLSYNINTLPTTFLLDREGNIVGRSFDFKTLDNEIKKRL